MNDIDKKHIGYRKEVNHPENSLNQQHIMY
jgi:hypothetical protein